MSTNLPTNKLKCLILSALVKVMSNKDVNESVWDACKNVIFEISEASMSPMDIKEIFFNCIQNDLTNNNYGFDDEIIDKIKLLEYLAPEADEYMETNENTTAEYQQHSIEFAEILIQSQQESEIYAEDPLQATSQQSDVDVNYIYNKYNIQKIVQDLINNSPINKRKTIEMADRSSTPKALRKSIDNSVVFSSFDETDASGKMIDSIINQLEQEKSLEIPKNDERIETNESQLIATSTVVQVLREKENNVQKEGAKTVNVKEVRKNENMLRYTQMSDEDDENIKIPKLKEKQQQVVSESRPKPSNAKPKKQNRLSIKQLQKTHSNAQKKNQQAAAPSPEKETYQSKITKFLTKPVKSPVKIAELEKPTRYPESEEEYFEYLIKYKAAIDDWQARCFSEMDVTKRNKMLEKEPILAAFINDPNDSDSDKVLPENETMEANQVELCRKTTEIEIFEPKEKIFEQKEEIFEQKESLPLKESTMDPEKIIKFEPTSFDCFSISDDSDFEGSDKNASTKESNQAELCRNTTENELMELLDENIAKTVKLAENKDKSVRFLATSTPNEKVVETFAAEIKQQISLEKPTRYPETEEESSEFKIKYKAAIDDLQAKFFSEMDVKKRNKLLEDEPFLWVFIDGVEDF